LKTFKKALKEVQRHNADSSKSWKIGLNQFSDLTKEEFRRIHLKPLKFQPNLKTSTYSTNGFEMTEVYYSSADGPAQWIPINYTTQCGKVWDQGGCGCCYVFSMLNNIECNYNIKKGVLPALSRQQVVDCNALTGGCDGGDPSMVAFYAKSQGLNTDASYPFTQVVGTCNYNANGAVATYLDGIETIGSSYPSTMATNPFAVSFAVYNMLTRGALSVTIDGDVISNYTTGIILLQGCSSPNHEVMIVGFGIDSSSGKHYWIVKNSWNTWWGEQGYMRVQVIDDSLGNCYMHLNPYRAFLN